MKSARQPTIDLRMDPLIHSNIVPLISSLMPHSKVLNSYGGKAFPPVIATLGKLIWITIGTISREFKTSTQGHTHFSTLTGPTSTISHREELEHAMSSLPWEPSPNSPSWSQTCLPPVIKFQIVDCITSSSTSEESHGS